MQSSFATLLLFALVTANSGADAASTVRFGPIPDRPIVFPILNEKGLGDICQVQYPTDPYPKTGFCMRVQECESFSLRVFYQPNFNVHQELCYFEVHDPVVCCLSARDAEPSVVGQRTELDKDWPYEFERVNAV
ncbi:uncharacterized protein LOC134205921 [Armigeres subalbatus]|uniref:uncharacterized protein LOC134205921 n=1 Tax=Armigeres subalbatus TaxID=124917 RepID=UPI002ED62C91